MTRLGHALSLAGLLVLCPPPARAQVSIHIDLGLPVAPRLVVVEPGIQVVEGFDDEVFFHRGWYWCRRSDGWYRSRSPRAHFYGIEYHRVPPSLMRMPEGRYRNWHHDMPHPPAPRPEPRPLERPDARRPIMKPQHERREEKREEKRERREEKRDRRDERGKPEGPRGEEGRGHR